MRHLPRRRKLRFSQNCALFTDESDAHAGVRKFVWISVRESRRGGERGSSSDRNVEKKLVHAGVCHFIRTLSKWPLSAVAPVLNKAPAVSTGKAANTNSMMVWQPHGNKCVRFPASPRSPARPRFSGSASVRDLLRRRAPWRRGSRRSLSQRSLIPAGARNVLLSVSRDAEARVLIRAARVPTPLPDRDHPRDGAGRVLSSSFAIADSLGTEA